VVDSRYKRRKTKRIENLSKNIKNISLIDCVDVGLQSVVTYTYIANMM
jgi:hypothetical protein